MTIVTNPANICFRNFYTTQMKPSFTFVTFSAIFFQIDLDFLDNFDDRYHTKLQVL